MTAGLAEVPLSRVLELISTTFYIVAAVVLLLLAGVLIVEACWHIGLSLVSGQSPSGQILESVGLVIIAFAVMELSKFVTEEEVLRRRELRSAREARRSLTKFVTIIIIAFSLEALVMAFEANRGDVQNAIYPAALFAASVFALIGLGVYQWLSSRVEAESMSDRRDSGVHEDK